MKPKSLSSAWRVLDICMAPVMRFISGAPFERPQESHHWHAQRLSENEIRTVDINLAVIIAGNDRARINTGKGPLFHIPLIGGWRNYAVLEVQSSASVWHIAWIVRDIKTNEVVRADIHKLPISDRRVRLLVGTPK